MVAIGTHLQFVFNKSIDQKMFPEKFKLAFISAVCKKDDAKICWNCRKFSINRKFAKFFERILLNQVNEFSRKKKLSGSKFAFQKHKFSTDATLHLFEALQ